MAVLQKINIDGYGNALWLNAEETGTSTDGNYSSVHVWLDLSVVSGGSVKAYNIRVNTTGGNEDNLGYREFYAGSHRLKDSYFTAYHNPDGSGSVYIEGYFNSGIGNWNLSGTLSLTKLARQSTINSFTGNDIKGGFSATYTAKSSSYENRLRISIPNVKSLETYKNYQSGAVKTLSEASINYIRNYTNNKTIQLGGVIETWSGSTKVGESSEIRVTCKIAREVHVFVNGTDKKAIPYVRVNNEWKEAVPYIGVNGSWKEEN